MWEEEEEGEGGRGLQFLNASRSSCRVRILAYVHTCCPILPGLVYVFVHLSAAREGLCGVARELVGVLLISMEPVVNLQGVRNKMDNVSEIK